MRILYLYVLLLLSAAAAAQTAVPFKLWGLGAYTTEPGDHDLLATDDGFLDLGCDVKITARISTTNYKLTLRRYTRDMALQQEVELGADKLPNGPFRPRLMLIGDKPYLLFYRYDGDRSQVGLYRALVNQATLAVGQSEELMSWEQKSNSTMTISDEYFRSRILLDSSPDGSKFFVFHASSKEGNCRAAVFSSDGKRLWYAEHNAPKPKGDADIRSACIDNDGRLYFGSSKGANGKNTADGFVVIMDGKSIDREIPLSNLEIYDVFVCPSRDGKTVHVAGTFSYGGSIVAVYHSMIEPSTGKLAPLDVTAFDAAFQRRLEATVTSRLLPGVTGVPLMHLQLFLMPDGSIDMGGSGTSETYDHRLMVGSALLNVRFGAGAPVVNIVPRFWRSFFGYGAATRLLPFGNSMLLVYNDTQRNLKGPLEGKVEESDYRNVVLGAALIGPTGKVERMTLTDRKKDDPLAMPEYAFRQGGALYMPLWTPKGQGIPGKKTQWAMITAP
ncbi:hypothetical protein [Flaviaesturariibacter terrae]